MKRDKFKFFFLFIEYNFGISIFIKFLYFSSPLLANKFIGECRLKFDFIEFLLLFKSKKSIFLLLLKLLNKFLLFDNKFTFGLVFSLVFSFE